MQTSSRGSSMVEYGVIAALVAIAIVGVCITLGGGINQRVVGVKSDMRGHVQKAAAAEILQQWGNGSGIGLGGAAQYPSPSGTTAHCFSNGICLNIPDAEGTTATMGANGADLTKAYTNIFSQLVSQLEAQNSDPALVALVKKLSQKGHALGDEEQHMINICPPGQPCWLPGSEHSVDGVLDMSIGVQNDRATFNDAYRDLRAYMKTHPDALNADMRAVIGNARWNINQIANTFGEADSQGWESTISVSGGEGEAVEAGYDGDAGHLTHVNANTIHATVLP